MNRQKDRSLGAQLSHVAGHETAMPGILTSPRANRKPPAETLPSVNVRGNDEFHYKIPATRTWHQGDLARFSTISPLGGNSGQ